MHRDLTPFSANLVWRDSKATALKIEEADSVVYFKWVLGFLDGEWHLHISDAWGNLTEMGTYADRSQATAVAEHFELWEWDYRTWASRNKAPVSLDSPKTA